MGEEKPAENNFLKFVTNPRSFTLKKWFYDLLGIDYASHDIIIERVSTALTTEQDVQDFGKLIGQVFEKGYRRAVEDYRQEIERLGLQIKILPPAS